DLFAMSADNSSQLVGKQKFSMPYRRATIAIGALAFAYSCYRLPQAKLDLRFLLITIVTILVSSRVAIKIPRINANITVSDTFIFLTLLLYGGEAGILLAAAEGLFSGLRISKTPITVFFNSAMMVCSTFLTVSVARFFFGPFVTLRSHDASFLIVAIGAM